MQTLTIATRGSKLALWQAEHVKDRLESLYPERVRCELLVLKTTGDKILDTPLAKIGGKGLFTKEIEEALLDGRADLAVHSMKDVPVAQPEGLVVGVTPEREDVTDTLLSVLHADLDALPEGATVGTSSLRRECQLRLLRPDLSVTMLRGNVNTRLQKLMDGVYDAIVMATAGMNRLGLTAPHTARLAPPRFLPAVAQGALGVEYREDDRATAELLAPLNHAPSRTAVMAERGFLTGLDGGCQVPIACASELSGGRVKLTGLVADPHGGPGEGAGVGPGVRLEAEGDASTDEAAFAVGMGLAERVLAAGAREILARVYAQ